ncbi:hypothetical protein NQ318_021481 [Aromia moschata]|uniref:Uncharacterized protein n=1 Tax=Aromia moschata TaxID=1265417 RepID=A0AAV8ZD41_9CUCU|nr:hypothetical protein NQ318_021481 [Aromia moschata]
MTRPQRNLKLTKKKGDEKNLMSVLELLELQARARAIRSQLALESKRKAELKENENKTIESDDDNEDAVIIESPKNIEILITSSESENEESRKNVSKIADCQTEENEQGSSSKQSVSGFEEEVLEYKEKGSEIVSEKKVGNESSSIKVSEGNSIEIETVNKGNNGTENAGEQSNDPSTSKDHSHSMSTPANPKQIIINEQIIISKPRTSDIQSKMDKEDVISKKRQLDEEEEGSLRNKRTDNDRELIDTQSNDEDYKTKTQTEESNSYLQDKVSCMEENEGIIINVDQSEIECIVSD